MTTLIGMIATVGGQFEPVVKAALEGKPSRILFVVSDTSRPRVEADIIPRLDHAPQYEYLEVSDAQDMEVCYKEIRADIDRWMKLHKLTQDEVFIDYTGGTKSMTAALTLAAVERFSNFTYVGGDERNKEGLGTVVSGTERVIRLQNPWNTYAVRELERANWLLEDFHADAAAQILEEAAQKCGDELKPRIETYAGIAKCLARIDRFDFGRQMPHDLRRYLNGIQFLDYSLHEKLFPLWTHWRAVGDQIRSDGETPGRETLLELLANAQRRAGQSSFDDATARLYRIVELHGQILLKQAFGIELGKGYLEDFPEHIRHDVVKILGEPPIVEDEILGETSSGEYRVGLQHAYKLLELSDDSTISSQSQYGERLENHLSKRNNSILAHGARPVSKQDYEEFWEQVIEALGIEESEIPHWPSITFTL